MILQTTVHIGNLDSPQPLPQPQNKNLSKAH